MRFRHHLLLLILLAASIGLRVLLARQGGQYFWIDEAHRFSPCIEIVDAIRYHGPNWIEAGDVLATHEHHIGFFLVGIPVAFLYEHSGLDGMWVPAALLSLASVGCIALVFAIARRSGAGPGEALGAAFLMACSNVMFYSTRHILPYESALAAALGVLWLSLSTSRSKTRAYLLGLSGCLAYLIYYGYLSTVLVVLGLYVLRVRRPVVLVYVALGFVTPLLILHGFTLWWDTIRPDLHVDPFLAGVWRLMHGADQGDFAEGWRVPWAVLWYAEHGLLLIWVAGLLGAIILLAQGQQDARLPLWLLAFALLYGQMVLESTVLHVAVVEGRFARQLVPFLCLLTAGTVAAFVERSKLSGAIIAVIALACVVQAAFNFEKPLRLWYPSDVQRAMLTQYGRDVSFGVSVKGPANWEDRGSTRYVLMNTATFLYPAEGPLAAPRGSVIVRYDHPLQFFPYQYEIYGPESRTILRETDITMRLIDTSVPAD